MVQLSHDISKNVFYTKWFFKYLTTSVEQAETINGDGPAVRKEAGCHNVGQISLISIGKLIKSLPKSVHGQQHLVKNATI